MAHFPGLFLGIVTGLAVLLLASRVCYFVDRYKEAKKEAQAAAWLASVLNSGQVHRPAPPETPRASLARYLIFHWLHEIGVVEEESAVDVAIWLLERFRCDLLVQAPRKEL